MNHSSAKAAFNKGMADRDDNHSVQYNSNESNSLPNIRFMSKTELMDRDMIADGAKQGLQMSIDND